MTSRDVSNALVISLFPAVAVGFYVLTDVIGLSTRVEKRFALWAVGAVALAIAALIARRAQRRT